MADAAPFTPDVVAAIVRHMNDDHEADALAIARGRGAVPEATRASVVGLGPEGIELVVEVDGEERHTRVPWGETPTDRPGVRHEIVRLLEEPDA